MVLGATAGRCCRSSWTPSIVPRWQDETVYLVLNDFGRQGRAWCETDTERTDLESVISDLMAGQYKDPVSVAASVRVAGAVVAGASVAARNAVVNASRRVWRWA